MKYYQAETHCHSAEISPCSRVPAQYLVSEYDAAGYKYVFLTDHYHPHVLERPELKKASWEERIDYFLSGYHKARECAQGTNVHVLLGMEVVLHRSEETGVGDDFLVYGFDKDFLMENPYLYRLSYEDFYRKISENGLLTFQAHPYRYGLKPVEPICYDGIEVINTHPRHASRNAMAIDFVAQHDLFVIGGSDAHAEEDIGRGGVMLPDGIGTPMDFVQFYRENGSPELIITFGADNI
ncbi:MAG: PHP-associated domain-containing protein [Christensenella sp.]|uniref:PHP-associated domain-containing protein n=1 Tax=Christensenella sp. TaxID=1935934 RepID=UPI002B20F7C5|nr:PHP-associated domain-containing protein [Christensenella sp.]MEA5003119.1 PHP-associated domain-containing protein [Christensenella sp.]